MLQANRWIGSSSTRMAPLSVKSKIPSPAKTLCFGYGNPSRGDDAIGPMLIDDIEAQKFDDVECLCDMQLQIEDITELVGREKIIFIDADMSCEAPFQFEKISAWKDRSYTSHAMTPEALLYAYRKVYGKDAPPTFILRIRGHQFELGTSIDEQTRANFYHANTFIKRILRKL